MYAQQQADVTPRLIDLVDRLSQRIPGVQSEPGISSQSAYNAGMFAPQQQAAIRQQEMALRNPQQGGISPQQYQAITRYFDSLSQVAYLGSQYAVLSEHLMRQCSSLEEAAMYGGQAIQLLGLSLRETESLREAALHGGQAVRFLGLSMRESESLRELVSVLQLMLADPYFLLTQAFEVWAARITYADTGFIELLSEAYLRLTALFEEKSRAANGNYSPEYTQYLQSQINSPAPTGLTNAIKGLSSSLSQGVGGISPQQQVSVGKQIQRQHAMMRQGIR